MTGLGKYRAHSVIREDRGAGEMILRSGYQMSHVVRCVGAWLENWAQATPDALFLAERSGAGWRKLSYGETRDHVRALSEALLARDLGPDKPILVLSGNGMDHALLMLAGHYVGIPIVPLAEQYSLIPQARGQIAHAANLVQPGLVYADDGDVYGDALALDAFADVDVLVSKNVGAGQATFESFLANSVSDAVDRAAAQVGPDTVAKYLMTSGSTSSPKAVVTTHRMICANQAQIADALPFLTTRPPRIVDWLPWNHVFGGSHNFNMMLANGGALYIDTGKPIPGRIDTTIENTRLMTGTLAFNVPVGFARMRDEMAADPDLRQRYFEDLDMLFYAGASMPQDVWQDLERMALEVRGDVPLMTSSWGLTETAPACLIQHEPTSKSGVIGVPMTGVEVKLITVSEQRYEIRVRGPNIMPGYLRDPEKTAQAFDDEGFFVTGDAVQFVDEDDLSKGLRFDGRIGEDFKLTSGTWVRAAALRLDVLQMMAPYAQDVVLCGAGQSMIAALVFPSAQALALEGTAQNGIWDSPPLRVALAKVLAQQTGKGSAQRVARVLVLSDPPALGQGEITAKGNLNFHKVLSGRADLAARLFDPDDPFVISDS